jgi:Tfp pilus assembly protein PilX
LKRLDPAAGPSAFTALVSRSALIKRFRRLLARQAGFALPMVIGVSLVLSITGTTAMVYSTENVRAASTSRADERSFSLAEAGLNYAYATLYNASDPLMPGAVPTRSEQVDNGTIMWWGTLDTETNTWTLTGRGSVPSPSGGIDVIRTVHGRASIQRTSVGTANNAIWNYVYADSTTTCTTLANSVNVNVPFYVRGDLCLQNTAQISGVNTVLHVGGTLTLNNSSHVASAGAPLAEVHVGGGCKVGNGTLHSPCGTADNVYSAMPPDAVNPGFVKPPVDIPYWYSSAKPGPKQACTSQTGTPPAFDNDAALNRSLLTAVDLTPALGYDCQVKDAQGNLLGQISWTPGSPGTLTIAGTLFFDGNISLQNSVDAVYVGRATIYAAGTISINNSTRLCGVVGCNASWDPTVNLLAFVAGSSTDTVGFSIQNSSVFQGAIYAVNDYSEQTGSDIWGPIVARQVSLSNNTTNHYVPLGTLLGGLPQTSQEAISIVNQTGSWG